MKQIIKPRYYRLQRGHFDGVAGYILFELSLEGGKPVERKLGGPDNLDIMEGKLELAIRDDIARQANES